MGAETLYCCRILLFFKSRFIGENDAQLVTLVGPLF
jgi:hypothetical protein